MGSAVSDVRAPSASRWTGVRAAPTLLRRWAGIRGDLRAWGIDAARWSEARRRAVELDFLPTGADWWRRTDRFKAMVLYAFCRRLRPSAVVETGVASGTSSLGILAALADNRAGTLHSVDLPEATYRRDDGAGWVDPLGGRETGWRVPEALRDRWHLERGPSLERLPPLLTVCGAIDLFYHDSEHTARVMDFEIARAWAALRPGGLLLVDNVDWSDSFARFRAAERPRASVIFPFLGIAEKPRAPVPPTGRPTA